MSDKPTTRDYRLCIEHAAERGGVEALPDGQRRELEAAVAELGIDPAAVENDLALWRVYLATVAAAERAKESLATKYRPSDEIATDLAIAKAAFEVALAELVKPLREIVLERCGRDAAVKRLELAERNVVTPEGLSWAFLCIAKPNPGPSLNGRMMVPGIGEAEVLK